MAQTEIDTPYEILDHTAVAAIFRNCIAALQAPGDQQPARNLQAVATKIANGMRALSEDPSVVTADNLKAFCRVRKTGRVNANNNTLRALHIYFTKFIHRHEPAVKAVLLEERNWDILHGKTVDNQNGDARKSTESVRFAWRALTAWFQVAEKDVNRTIIKVCGEYVVIRRSMADNTSILKSSLSLRWDSKRKIIEATHVHRDRYGATRTTSGLLLPLRNSTAALVLQVEDAEAIEFILLRIPINQNFTRMMGFIISVNVERQPVSSRLFFERHDAQWDSLSWRFDLEALKDWPDKLAAVTAYLEHTKANTLPDQGPSPAT